jgi:DNA helicase-2/ATP-dependent DNA helicase PcrA
LNKFIKRVLTFEAANDDKSVKNFLSEFRMELESGEQGSVTPDEEAGPETIKVMTVHGSKGLEFKYVFIVGMVDKRFPTIERKDKILIPNALIKEVLPEGDVHLEEERRLFYVAATRAKIGLYFSWSKNYGGARDKKPSRFLLETNLIGEEKQLPSTKQQSLIAESKLLLPRPAGEGRGEGKATSDKIDYTPPKHYSYTQLTAFASCPYQYRFAHILKIPRQGKGVFSFGRTMHSTLQKLFELVVEKKGFGQQDLFAESKNGSENVSWEEVMRIYEESWLDDWYNDADEKEKYRAKGEAILKTFYTKHKDNWPSIKHLEKGFNIKLQSDTDTYTIRGVVDRVDAVDGKVRIVDYKTGTPKDKLTFEDKAQLFIYQIAAEEIFGYKVDSLVFYYLDDNSEMEFLGKDKDLEKLKENIVKNIKEINKGEFPAKPSILCKYCDFNDICEFRKL